MYKEFYLFTITFYQHICYKSAYEIRSQLLLVVPPLTIACSKKGRYHFSTKIARTYLSFCTLTETIRSRQVKIVIAAALADKQWLYLPANGAHSYI